MLSKNKKLVIAVSTIIVVGLIAVGAFLLAKRSDRSSQESTVAGGAVADPNVPVANSEDGGGSNNSSSKDPTPANPPAGIEPAAPSGAFVSSNQVSLSGDRSNVSSVCTTTAGATCTIRFVQGSSVKELSPQKTDGNGHTVWYWNTGQVGLGTGSWKIIGIASLNGKSTETTYPLSLEVQ